MDRRLFWLLLAAVVMLNLTGTVSGSDAEGSADHPLLSRFPGSKIVFYHQLQFDESFIPTNAIAWSRDEEHNLVHSFPSGVTAAGQVTRIQYEIPVQHSTEEVYRSYREAFDDAGLEILFTGEGPDLGRNFGQTVFPDSQFASGTRSQTDVAYYVHSSDDLQRFISAKSADEAGDVYIMVFAGVSIHKPEPAVQVEIIETRPLPEAQITVNPDFERSVPERMAFDPSADVEGGQDHPLLSRYAGTRMLFYDETQFDSYELALGPVESYRDEDHNLIREFSHSQTLEGKITRIQYEAPRDRSTTEIQRNYEKALQQSGFEILYQEAGPSLGSGFAGLAYPSSIFDSGVRTTRDVGYYVGGRDEHHQYLAAKLPSPDGNVYVTVFSTISVHKPEPAIQVEIIEELPMDADLVTVDAAYMRDALERTGSMALYGIHFDTDSAVMKPKSRPTLDEIADLLASRPDLDLFVVGHTDSVGAYEYNLELSQRRARSVVDDLTANYGIDTKRLQPVGVGPVAPTASNETAEGRSRNRRVELVVR